MHMTHCYCLAVESGFFSDVICLFACSLPRNYQTYLSDCDNSSLSEGVVTESMNKEMKIEDDIPKEVLSSTSLTSHDSHKAQGANRDIKVIMES